MSCTEHFKYKNVPNAIIEEHKKWMLNNPNLARRKPKENDFFEIEVFGYGHKKVADELYKALKDSGFLEKHPLFSIKIQAM